MVGLARIGRAVAALAVTALLFTCPRVASCTDATNLLQPGSRPSLALGGDPFLSPLVDSIGWWGAAPISSSKSIAFAVVGDGLLSEFGSGGSGHASDSRLSSVVTGLTHTGRVRLAYGVSVAAGVRDGVWRSGGGSASVRARQPTLEGGVRAEGLAPGLSAMIVAPVPFGRQAQLASSFRTGLRYTPGRFFAAQAGAGRAHVPEVLNATFQDQEVKASLDVNAHTYQGDVLVRPVSWAEIEANGASAFIDALSDPDTTTAYAFAPKGRVFQQQCSAMLRAPKGRAIVRWSRSDFDLKVKATWAAQQYGRVSLLKGDRSSWLVALDSGTPGGPRWLLEAERADMKGAAFGVVESWPFTSLLVSLLGERGYADASMSASWWRVHAGTDQRLGGVRRLQMGLTWFDIAPEVHLRTWASAVAGIGVRDLRFTQLDVHRVQLAVVSVGPAGHLGGAEWSVALRQFVFAKGFDTKVAAAEATGSQSSRSHRRLGWPGGTRLEATVRIPYGAER